MIDDLHSLADDGLITPLVGDWGLTKYRLAKNYAEMFAKSMLGKWDARVYIDLFAGSGRACIKRTGQIVLGSPLSAIDIQHPFDKYVYCEIDMGKFEALRTRVNRDFPSANATSILGDANLKVEEILAAIPTANRQYRVLSFCFADPFRLQDLSFSTIEHLSTRYIDFLILIPAYMDANRNPHVYLRPDSTRIDRFLGFSEWRSQWLEAERAGLSFGTFIADQFGKQMARLGYTYRGLEDTELIRESSRNRPLYRLAFFSRSQLGVRFWEQARRYSQQQLPLFR